MQTSLTVVTGASTITQTYIPHWPTPAPTIPPSPTPTPSAVTVTKVCFRLLSIVSWIDSEFTSCQYGQCGGELKLNSRTLSGLSSICTGVGWAGPTLCVSGSTCQQLNPVSSCR